ncbi:hypothetical protein K523DRAFT_418149 [Schizophyllum commune Tattone D]|nr:hypothetical protein K523DRAFT_418149 [Schizophyllum commune Tattone D]
MAQSHTASKSSIDAQLERFLEVDNIYNQSTLPGLQIQSTPPQAPYTIVLLTEQEKQRITIDPRALMLFTITVHGVKPIIVDHTPRADNVTNNKHTIAVYNEEDVMATLACPDQPERTLYVDLTKLKRAGQDAFVTLRHGGNRWGQEQVVGLDIRVDATAPPTTLPAPANNNTQRTPPRRVFSSTPARRQADVVAPPSDPLAPPPMIIFSVAPPRSTTPPGLPPIPPPFSATLAVDSDLERAMDRPALKASTHFDEKREPAAVGMQRTKRRTERYTPYGSRPVKRAVYKVVSTAADGLTVAGGLLRGWADSYFGDAVDQVSEPVHV